jgi:hypothetical protein
MTGEGSIPSRCLYAFCDNDTMMNERASEAIVPWWSFTKTVIAAAVLTPVRDGRLSLDDPHRARVWRTGLAKDERA